MTDAKNPESDRSARKIRAVANHPLPRADSILRKVQAESAQRPANDRFEKMKTIIADHHPRIPGLVVEKADVTRVQNPESDHSERETKTAAIHHLLAQDLAAEKAGVRNPGIEGLVKQAVSLKTAARFAKAQVMLIQEKTIATARTLTTKVVFRNVR